MNTVEVKYKYSLFFYEYALQFEVGLKKVNSDESVLKMAMLRENLMMFVVGRESKILNFEFNFLGFKIHQWREA